MKPLWIDFEGVDGSGKTTVSTRVAEALRRRGAEVVHAREGGVFASRIAGRVRDLVRGTDCLGIAPETELLLNLAREAQLVSEVIRPALARGAWVITDRTTYSHLALARYVRGLSASASEAAARMATGGLRPERVFLIDVDPDIARWRRRVRKVRERRLGDSGRKGLIGEALVAKTRCGLADLAVAGDWTLIDNTWASLEETVAAVLGCLDGAPPPAPRGGFEADPADVAGSFLRFAAGLKDRALAAMLAAGLDDPRADGLRRAAPADVAAFAVSGMDAGCAWALREELREEEPYYVARGLTGLPGHDRAWRLRRALETSVPDQVLHSLVGEAGDEAHALRLRHWEEHAEDAVRSTRGVSDPGAWSLRARSRREGPSAALAESLAGLDAPEAWEIRAELREAFPLAVLKGLKGVDHPEAWRLRRALAGPATKSVLSSLEGLEGAEAAALRGELKGAAPEETASSLAGLEGPDAWGLREELADVAPSGVIRSLRRTPGPRADALAASIVARHPRRLRVVREAVQYRMNPQWTNTSI